MKHVLWLILCLCGWGAAHAQTVSDVDSYQSSKQIEVTYTLDKRTDISVYCSTDGGRTYGPALQQVTGDVGEDVTPGRKRLVWNVLEEVESLTGDRIVFKVVPDDGFFCDMVFVKGGTFTMGATAEQGSNADDYERAHQVTVSDFYIGKYEVTQAQWMAVMGKNPSEFKGDDLPVENVSWIDIQEFLRKLNAQAMGKHYRLPTEAEWEYAARGGNKSRGYKYSGGNTLAAVAWYFNYNSDSKTHPVGQKLPNELGVYDMTGNVNEWCQDRYRSYRGKSQTNPTGPSTGSMRVRRGGSWYSNTTYCRVSLRNAGLPRSSYTDTGLRLVCF